MGGGGTGRAGLAGGTGDEREQADVVGPRPPVALQSATRTLWAATGGTGWTL